MHERLVDLAEAHQAQGNVAVILAHRWLRLQRFADLERLLIALECVLVATQQQADTADVAERVTQPARKLNISVDCEGFFVLRQRSLVVAQFIEDEAQVVDCGAFQLAIANLLSQACPPVETALSLHRSCRGPIPAGLAN